MKYFCILFTVSLLAYTTAYSQPTKYVVVLKDKTGTPFSINEPSKYLSKKSIDRRLNQDILINESDLPVNPTYVENIRIAGTVSILNQSKWLNQICIETTDINALQKIKQFSFVKLVKPVNGITSTFTKTKDKFLIENTLSNPNSFINGITDEDYGNSTNQIHIHEGEFLHNKGFRGDGILISIIDAGFYHYQTLPAFDSVRKGNQILDTYDFVTNTIGVNESNAHGMQCFSIIASNIPGKLIGSGDKANFLLYRSEDVDSEFPIEEQNWIVAAERSDSAGADIITTSLGYNTFDNPAYDYIYNDMDGKTTMIAQGANIAAKKGMIILAAAGNEGSNSWHYITTPADAIGILSVGAVNGSGQPASFSSYGPSSDGRVKPEVASIGVSTAISSINGEITYGNGTSFATPNLAGLTACLWQAFPDFKSSEIIQAIEKSSSIYNNPDDRIGYGIPNFRLAFEALSQERILRKASALLGESTLKAYPNPFRDHFTIIVKPENTSNASFLLYDIAGKLIFKKQVAVTAGQIQLINFDKLPPLQKGVYVLTFVNGKKSESIQLIFN